MDKDTREVLKEAERQGFTVTTTRKGHAQVRDEHGQLIATFGGSASDVRALRNGIAQLKRAGSSGRGRGRGEHDHQHQ